MSEKIDNPIVANLLSDRVLSRREDHGLGRFYLPQGRRFGTSEEFGTGQTIWILSSKGRAILLTATLLVMLGILLLHPRRPLLPWYYVLGWTLLAVWVGRMCLRTSPMLMAPILFCMYFLIGYPLKIVYGQLSSWLFPMLSTGMYFARKSVWLDLEIFLAALASMVGVALAVKIVLILEAQRERRQVGQVRNKPGFSGPVDKQTLILAVCAFVIFLFLLCVFMWRYRIGQTGVRAVALPYRLTGIAVQLRSIFVPMMELYLFWQALKLRSRGLLWLMTIVIVAEAMLSGFLSMSRGAVVARVIVFAVFSAKIYKELPTKLLLKVLLGGACLLILHVLIIAPSITIFRMYTWQGHSVSSAMQAAIAKSLRLGNYQERLDFIFARVLGVEDLMGVAAYKNKSLSLMYNTMTSGQGMRFVNYNMFGLEQFSGRQLSGRTFSGRGMSIIGYLYLSGNMLVVLAGSAAICLIVCMAEIYLDRRAVVASAVWVTVCMPGVWEGAFRPLFYGFIVFFSSYWFLTKMFDPWLRSGLRRSVSIKQAQARLAKTLWAPGSFPQIRPHSKFVD